MTCKKYIELVHKLQDINDKICKVNDVLQIELFEGPIGELYDFAYELMLPEGTPDELYDRFGAIVFSYDTDDKTIEEFFNNLFKGE